MKQIIISKEDAVFWMDKNGTWHNEHGPFEHPKIIKYFHSSIHKDEQGYYVHQSTDQIEEKVYFNYEDTALFVYTLITVDKEIVLVLNTGQKLTLDPETLFAKDDNLYAQTPDHCIKFTTGALVKISDYLDDEGDTLVITVDGKTFPIPEEHP